MGLDRQGRGHELDESRIERIAQRAKENGQNVDKAIRDEVGSSMVVTEIQNAVREKMYQLLGK